MKMWNKIQREIAGNILHRQAELEAKANALGLLVLASSRWQDAATAEIELKAVEIKLDIDHIQWLAEGLR